MTISSLYGSALIAVLKGLEEQLHYRLINDELPEVVATRMGISRETAEQVGSAPKSLPERILGDLTQATPELSSLSPLGPDIDAEYARAVERAVREAAQGGDCIIVGRAAGWILRQRQDIVRVFVCAPLPWRAARVAAALGYDHKAALAEIARVDEGRAKYAREYYDIDRNDATRYHLVLDISRFGIEGTIDLIARAVAGAQSTHNQEARYDE